jgi:hypothetical protein
MLTLSACATTAPQETPDLERYRLVYAARDGLYSLTFASAEAFAQYAGGAAVTAGKLAGAPERIVEEIGISSPILFAEGKKVAFLRVNGDAPFVDARYPDTDRALYVYDFSDQSQRLLADDFISWCHGQDHSFYVSTRREGIFRVDADGEREIILPVEAINQGEQVYYERLELSPDSSKLAFTKTRTVGTPDGGYIQQSLGVWVVSAAGASADLQQVQAGAQPVDEASSATDAWYYPLCYPAGWSADSTKLLIWQVGMSGSINADGVSLKIYDFISEALEALWVSPADPDPDRANARDDLEAAAPELADQNGLLAYDENICFYEDGRLLLLGGIGREMIYNKYLRRFAFTSDEAEKTLTIRAENLETPGLIPATPLTSADGQTIYFAGALEPDPDQGWENSFFLHREIYALQDEGTVKLTDDTDYTSESPILSEDGNTLVFGRIDENRNMSIWRIGIDGTGLYELAAPVFAEDAYGEPVYYNNYYGRGNWYDLLAVF